MTQEDKQLLLKDICARLPYGVKCQINCKNEPSILKDIFIDGVVGNKGQLGFGFCSYGRVFQELEDVKPFLRPMSNMTEEELIELLEFEDIDYNNNSDVVKRAMMAFSEDKKIESNSLFCIQYARSVDWLNAHHFDYRGLIEKGLALEAPDYMYNFENND